jgi:adenylate cyclase
MTSLRSGVKLILMKKLSTYLFLILFSFSAPSFADDISDFQIEGMSIGDSALDYFTKEEIDNNKYYLFKNKNWVGFSKIDSSYETYEAIQFFFKENDKKYTIYRLEGKTLYESSDEYINECRPKKKEVIKQIETILQNAARKQDNRKFKHASDKSGLSTVEQVLFVFKDGSVISVECKNWSEKITKEKGFYDNFQVSISFDEFLDFLDIAYK